MFIILLFFLLGAAVTDIVTNRVKNRWIYSGAVTGLVLNSILEIVFKNDDEFIITGPGFLSSLLGLIIPLGFICIYQMRLLGAADVKLFMLIGCYTGITHFFSCLVYILFSAAILAVAIQLYNYYKYGSLLSLADSDQKSRGYNIGHYMPLAPAMFIGAMVWGTEQYYHW